MAKDQYSQSAFHPRIQTTSDKHTEKKLFKSYRPNLYLNQISHTETGRHGGHAVVGQIVEVRTEPALQLWGKIDNEGGRYVCTLPSVLPTSGAGKSVAVPKDGQRFAGILSQHGQTIHITSFFGLIADCGEEGTEKPLKKAQAGDVSTKTGGKFTPTTKLSEDGTIGLTSGNLCAVIMDGAQGKQTSTFKEATLVTHGHTSIREYKPKDFTIGVPHVASYTFIQEKYKDLNFVSDKFQDTETKLMLPGLTPYIDKAIVRAGYIKGENPIEDLGHVYEIRTQQTHTDG